MDRTSKPRTQCTTKEEMHGGWQQGVVAIIRKSGRAATLKNYRAITLRSIYKIWAAIAPERLKPIMRILAKETQRGHHLSY